MAKVSFGPVVSEVHGTIGSVTFASSRSGPIARRLGPPKTNHTAAQRQAQLIFGNASRAWKSLDLSNQLAWSRAATSICGVCANTAQRLSGFSLWMKTFAGFAAAGLATPTSAPMGTATPPLVLSYCSAHFDIPELFVGFYSLTPLSDTIVFARAAQAMTNAPPNTWRCWRWIGQGLYADGPLDFASGYVAAFGNPIESSQGILELFAQAPGHPPSNPLYQQFDWHSA